MLKHLKNKEKNHRGRLFIMLASAISFLLLLICSDIAIEYMKKGLKLCSTTVIPSLFPFMVISELIVSSGLGRIIGKALMKPARVLLGVSEGVACAFILGAVCGFPIGARSVSSLLDCGEIDSREASSAMMFCNNPGSAFVISAVGTSLFGSARLGVMLYVCTLLSAVIVGRIGGLIMRAGSCEKKRETKSAPPLARQESGAELFTTAIKSSAISMLTVCALVAFFSALVGCVGDLLGRLGASENLTAAIFCFFELSSGVSAAAEMTSSPPSAILLTAAALGWSGLSVHFQVMTVSSGRGISYKPYFLAKLAQGIVSATLAALSLKFLPFSEDVFKEISLNSPSKSYTNAAFVCLIFFFGAISPIFIDKICQKQCKKSKRKIF